MNAFLEIPAERRRLAFQQVDESMGLQAFSVEKDFWVCWILRDLFTLPGIVSTSPSRVALRSRKRGR